MQIVGEVWVLPESPRFLVSRGDYVEARKSLERLSEKTDKPVDVDALVQILQIEKALEREEEATNREVLLQRGIQPNSWKFVSLI